jgi:small subunit ribosomal protein S1
VQPGDEVKVKILEIDSERRRLSLSIKRVEGQVLPRRSVEGLSEAGDLEDMPELGLSEDVFAEGAAAPVPATDEEEPEAAEPEAAEPEAEVEPPSEAPDEE